VRPFCYRAGALAPLLLALAGCAEGKADVTGKVTHQGKAVTWGTVIVQGPDGIPMTGKIQPDGAYTVRGVAAGKVLIGVVSRDPGVLAGPRGRRVDKGEGNDQPAVRPPLADRSKWFALPEKYEDPANSGLSTTVKGGANAHDIDLP
jgi:hypothetical protein